MSQKHTGLIEVFDNGDIDIKYRSGDERIT